ncbi:competence protein ComEA [Lactiplantibacillus paraplantarum]|uniref:Competence protein ComEA n=1 Tax=Lactiplantibacillus paraplantarum TaxID=60520 RepID=A0A4Q9Y0T3_9LACO|nr:competence protein ComEA [Lactiplantibacillus paraplantarum]
MMTWIKLLKAHWRIVGIGSALIIILITGWALSQLRQPQSAVPNELLASSESVGDRTSARSTTATSTSATGTVPVNPAGSQAGNDLPGYVDVKGAVNKPGLYQITASMRVADVIQLAQGMQPQADAQQVNLAAKVTDQQVIYVPVKSEQPLTVVKPPVTPSASSNLEVSGGGHSSTDKVNLNTADVAALQKLSGIGQKKAEKIIDYRQQHGNFKTIDDLKNVSGFGEKTVAKYKDQLTV